MLIWNWKRCGRSGQDECFFLDTNVVIDFYGKRDGFFEDASLIFQMQKEGRLNATISSLTVVNCAYILGKAFSKEVMLKKVEELCRLFQVSGIDRTTIVSALEMKPYDFEDAVQYLLALPYQPDIIITRDKKGFSAMETPTMTPAEFIAICRK